MNLSFLRSRKQERHYSAALSERLAEMVSSLRSAYPKDIWLASICAFHDRARSLSGPSSPSDWNHLAKDVASIFGAMGSFNDNVYPQHLRDVQEALYNSAIDTIRATRRELGGSWVSVADQDRFHVGQRVALIKGETIALQRDEAPMKAPASPLVYIILGHLPNDVDNMPRYHIKSDSHVRNARHGALRAVGAP